MNKHNKKERISVLIPVYNGERYLAETLKSVLSQSHPPTEVIVIDDGSTDGSAEIVRTFGGAVKYLRQSNQGTASAFNLGIEHAEGDFFSFLGADDLWTRDKIKLQIEAFRDNPRADIVSGHVRQFISPDIDEEARKKIQYAPGLIPGQVLPAMLIKRRSFFKVGLFDIQWRVGSEMSWLLRARDKNLRIVMLPDLALLRRIHDHNKGIVERRHITQRAEILKEALDRRRKMRAAEEGESDKSG